MRHGVPAACGALLTFLAVLPAALPAVGQDGGADDYTIPRTPWGDPRSGGDLEQQDDDSAGTAGRVRGPGVSDRGGSRQPGR